MDGDEAVPGARCVELEDFAVRVGVEGVGSGERLLARGGSGVRDRERRLEGIVLYDSRFQDLGGLLYLDDVEGYFHNIFAKSTTRNASPIRMK